MCALYFYLSSRNLTFSFFSWISRQHHHSQDTTKFSRCVNQTLFIVFVTLRHWFKTASLWERMLWAVAVVDGKMPHQLTKMINMYDCNQFWRFSCFCHRTTHQMTHVWQLRVFFFPMSNGIEISTRAAMIRHHRRPSNVIPSLKIRLPVAWTRNATNFCPNKFELYDKIKLIITACACTGWIRHSASWSFVILSAEILASSEVGQM